MRSFFAALLAGLCIGAWAAPVYAATKTVTGEVIALRCYFESKENVGKFGLICARASVKYEVNPVGLLTADGTVYQLAGGLVAHNNAKAVPLLSHIVTITGDIYEKVGMPMISADDAQIVK